MHIYIYIYIYIYIHTHTYTYMFICNCPFIDIIHIYYLYIMEHWVPCSHEKRYLTRNMWSQVNQILCATCPDRACDKLDLLTFPSQHEPTRHLCWQPLRLASAPMHLLCLSSISILPSLPMDHPKPIHDKDDRPTLIPPPPCQPAS